MVEPVVSETVWYKEIFEGFQNIVHQVLGEKYLVLVRKPEEDFKIEKYPSVVLQITTSQFNVDRYYKHETYISEKDKENFVGYEENTPLTYDINLQMDFYAEKATELDEMTIKWLSFFRRDFNLKVKTRGGKPDDVHVMPEGGAKRMDEVSGADRLFRNCFNYKVYGRLFERDRIEVPLVRKIVVSTKII